MITYWVTGKLSGAHFTNRIEAEDPKLAAMKAVRKFYIGDGAPQIEGTWEIEVEQNKEWAGTYKVRAYTTMKFKME